MTEPHEYAQPLSEGAEIKIISLRTPLFMVFLVIILVIVWGFSNKRINDQILERVEALHDRLDAIAPVNSE